MNVCEGGERRSAHLKVLVLLLRERPLRDHEGAQTFAGHVSTLERKRQATVLSSPSLLPVPVSCASGAGAGAAGQTVPVYLLTQTGGYGT